MQGRYPNNMIVSLNRWDFFDEQTIGSLMMGRGDILLHAGASLEREQEKHKLYSYW